MIGIVQKEGAIPETVPVPFHISDKKKRGESHEGCNTDMRR